MALNRSYSNDNQFTKEGLDALFGTLHSNAGAKNIYVYNNLGTADCDQNIATAKSWRVIDTQ